MTPTKRAIKAIIEYTKNAASHSALSTVHMLALEAMEEYDKDLELIDNLPKHIRDVRMKDT